MDGEEILNELDRSLKASDVSLLRAIRDINNAPTEYDGTDRGEVPANKPLITEVSDLSKSAVEYRLGESDLDEDGLGLIKVHPPTVHDRRFGPKSAELTRRGVEVLSALEHTESKTVDNVDEESVKQLRARVDALENREFEGDDDVSAGKVLSSLEQLHQRVDEMEEHIDRIDERVDAVESDAGAEWGAVDESTASDIRRVLDIAPALMLVWSEVLGIDIPKIVQKDTVTDEEVMAYRRHALETLREGIGTDQEQVEASVATPSATGEGSVNAVEAGGSKAQSEGETGGQPQVSEDSGDSTTQQEVDISRPKSESE